MRSDDSIDSADNYDDAAMMMMLQSHNTYQLYICTEQWTYYTTQQTQHQKNTVKHTQHYAIVINNWLEIKAIAK